MVRFIFTFLLLIHGLIHLLGFVKEFGLTQVSQLSGKTLIPLSGGSAKAMGVLWLFTALLFLVSAFTFLLKKDGWWMVASIALLLSQVLIIFYWPDAKIGTIANLIVLVGIMLAFGTWRFNNMVKQELKSLSAQPLTEKIIITSEMLRNVPPVVQKWLSRSNIIGKEVIGSVYLHQKGEMRTKPNGNWMPVKAEEYFSVYQPGFIWIADVKAAPFVHLAGRDKYENGRGNMLIKLLSLYPVADAKGKETDQGTLLRYLGEMVWFPSAALNNYITWEPINATAARATMSYGGVTATGVFRFNPDGDVISFEALRYYDRKEGATLENWFVAVDPNSYQEFEGIRVPTKSAVTWKLNTGDFTWFRLEITAINYNQLTDTLRPFPEKALAKTNTYEVAP